MAQYVYIESEPGLFTVGFYDPTGKWHPESDHDSRRDAINQARILNGAAPFLPAPPAPDLLALGTRLAEALERAAETIHGEFCGKVCRCGEDELFALIALWRSATGAGAQGKGEK